MENNAMSDLSFEGFLKPSALVSLRLAMTVVAGLFLVACGDSPVAPTGPSAPAPAPSNPSPAPTPVPTPTPSTPFTQTLNGTVNHQSSGDWLRQHNFIAPRDGSATVTLNWANGSVDLDLALTNPGCTFDNSSCMVYEVSAALTGTSERVVRTMTAGETYRIWIINYGFQNQAYTIEIDIR